MELQDWRYGERDWIGEAVGFTEWLRPASDPDSLGSLSLALTELPPRISQAVMHRMGLSLEAGMTLDDLGAILGAPVGGHQYDADRRSYEFVAGIRDRYRVGCTIQDGDGLVHVVIEPTNEPVETA